MSKSFDEHVAEMEKRMVEHAIRGAKNRTKYQAEKARELASKLLKRDWEQAAMGPIATKTAIFFGNLTKERAAENEGKVMTMVKDFDGEEYVGHQFTELDKLALKCELEELGEDPESLIFRYGEVLMPEDTYSRVKAKLQP